MLKKNEEDAQVALGAVRRWPKQFLKHSRLTYFDSRFYKTFGATDTTIISIDTDEGVLEPLGVGDDYRGSILENTENEQTFVRITFRKSMRRILWLNFCILVEIVECLLLLEGRTLCLALSFFGRFLFFQVTMPQR
ncbi:MAG: hypothetical protein CM15mP56_5110 [Alphaproteobacteria bacterium]|nr:MAG: hypothetical protein CM15mP56_5110 [Alphaproteobacteria bacterium]